MEAAVQTSLIPNRPVSPPKTYQARSPASCNLHKLIRENINTFLETAESSGASNSLPYFVTQEFERFLKCGALAHGFLRLSCTSCKKEKLLAFSCKGRAFCPSCLGKRQALSAEYLSGEVFPQVPVRQWVLSFPFGVRFLLAKKAKYTTDVLKITLRVISNYLRAKDKHSQTAAVTVVQRFGSSLNLNPHFHMLIADGRFRADTRQQEIFPHLVRNKMEFVPHKGITNEDVEKIVKTIQQRVLRYFQKQGLLEEQTEDPPSLFDELQCASISQRVAMGKRRNSKVRKFGAVRQSSFTPMHGPLCRSYAGFSLHAATLCQANETHKLEKLCQYITRPPFARKSITLQKNGDVLYKLKAPFNDGTTHLIFEPLEFIERLAAIVPKPRAHLIRYHGAFARNAQRKAHGVKLSPAHAAEAKPSKNKHWARLLSKVFGIDMTYCPHCHIGKLKIISAILTKAAIVRILSHLGLPAEPLPVAPARGPPHEQLDFYDYSQV